MLLGQGVLLWQTVRALIRFGEQGAASFPIFGTVGLLFTLFAFGLAVWARTKEVTAMNLVLEILPARATSLPRSEGAAWAGEALTICLRFHQRDW